jgi:hypothetical protein
LHFPATTRLKHIDVKKGEFRNNGLVKRNRHVNVPPTTDEYRFSKHSCGLGARSGCEGTKCGIILFAPENSSKKNTIFLRCARCCPSKSHDDCFDQYVDLFPDQSGYIGVLGFVEEKGRFVPKSGTFNYGGNADIKPLQNAFEWNFRSRKRSYSEAFQACKVVQPN